MLLASSTQITALSSLPQLNFDYDSSFEKFSKEWIKNTIITNSSLVNCESDIQIILNLLYFSCARSQITRQAQQATLDAMQNMWHGWQNIAQRRRNASKPIPYPHATHNIISLAESHKNRLLEHQTISSIYDNALEQIIKGDILENRILLSQIELLRDEARTATFNALGDAKSHIKELLEYLNQNEHKHSVINENEMEEMSDIRNALLSYIKENIPGYALHSFVLADNLFIKVSNYNWLALHSTQELSRLIWDHIEKARGNFYYTLYVQAYKQAEEIGIKPIIVFNEKGLLLPIQKRKKLLPPPFRMQ